MKPALPLIVLALLAGCEKKKTEPAPAKDPAPAKEPGATVPAPAPVAPPTAAAPTCGELRVTVGKDSIVHTRTDAVTLALAGGELDPDALAAAFARRAQDCVGAIVIEAADDVDYQRVVTVMDKALAAGFTDVGLDAPGDHAAGTPSPPLGKDQLDKVAVITVTKTDLSVGGKQVPLSGDLDATVGEGLAAARAAGAPAGTVVLQADKDTQGKVLNAVIRAAHKAGFDDVLFAIKRTP